MKLFDDFFHGVDRKKALSWVLFDFANSGYGVVILALVFPLYFKEVIAGQQYGDFYWGLIISLSILAAGIASPIVGAVADYHENRKRKFVTFALLAILGTACLYFTGPSSLFFASLAFILTNFFFQVSATLYDSFLAKVSSKKNVSRISGFGYGINYLGGILAMILLYPLYSGGYGDKYMLCFPLAALFFLIFSIPAFLYLKEDRAKKKMSIFSLAKIGFKTTLNTLRNMKRHKNIFWFLLAFYLMSDGLITVFAFIPIYAKTTLLLSLSEITIIFILVQLVAVPSAIFSGIMADKKGPKRVILTTIVLWSIIVLLLAIARTSVMFYFIAVLTGLVVGSSQGIARSWMSQIVPEKKRFEFFGFNGFASRLSATTGPLVFGTVSVLTGSQRIAMLALLPFFIASFLIFYYLAKEKNVKKSLLQKEI
jgi:UMF1 family MFS transporter